VADLPCVHLLTCACTAVLLSFVVKATVGPYQTNVWILDILLWQGINPVPALQPPRATIELEPDADAVVRHSPTVCSWLTEAYVPMPAMPALGYDSRPPFMLPLCAAVH
jgi:hypothetical protein